MNKASTGSHFVTILLGTWLVLGIFIDGYAHNHGVVETFFSPWHAILYSGFLACAAWISALIASTKKRTGSSWKEAVPAGYGLGLLGIVIFLAGGVFDMIWHIIFGIEVSIEALLSPSHLALMTGGILILSSPFRAGWMLEEGDRAAWRSFLPYLLSLALSIGVVCFFLMYAWTFHYNLASANVADWYAANAGFMQEDTQVRGITFLLLNTVALMYPVFLLMKRWQVPFGAFTFLFTFINVLMGVLDGFEQIHGIIVAFVAGAAADLLLLPFRGAADRRRASRFVAIVVPAVLWSGYYGWLAMNGGIGWVPELWAGSIAQACLVSFVLSVLAMSPDRVRP
ncbi:hypothetical protein [Paenibacillus arenilitoris]|uniref:Uncharacterized protein n=1 Tax=Paenibacillus arenilitoris TaxID=2772299 RepID=A0A927CM33_9BACL|nr:hypothetical protein [Paenibacillus arenilitoris]MBD2869925.1 hypothetical protein [Paenibacillus arenilitoris]